MEDYFSGENEKPRKNYFSFKEVGDKLTGAYIGKVKNDVVDKWGKIKMEYIFKTKDGYVFVSGRNYTKGGNPATDHAILYPMQNVQPGTVMGLKYTEDRDTGKGNPLKIIEAIYPDEQTSEPEAVELFEEEMGRFYDLDKGEQAEELEVSDESEVDINTIVPSADKE
jgi:hypothetical protein